MNVPTPPTSLVGTNRNGDEIGITAKITSGMTINIGTSGDATFGTPQGDDASLVDILYVIDANLGNCGGGYVMDEDGNFLDAAGRTTTTMADYVPVAIADGIAAAVGAGYTATLEAFEDVVAADADVKAKEMALNTLLEDDTEDGLQTNVIATAREDLMNSQAAQTRAHNALYAATGPDRDGSIYRAGVAEWRAKGAVESAIKAWNTAVNNLATADSALTTSSETFGDYVPLGFSTTGAGQILSLLSDPADSESNVSLANLRTYANAEGGNTGLQGEDGTVTVSNFDAAGNLLIPLSDADSDTDTPLTPTTSAQTYSVINTQLTQVNNVVTALEELQSENKNALLQETIDEAVRRAKLEQTHYQAQFDALVADNEDLDTTAEGVQSFKTMYDAFRTATIKRDNAGVTLETAVETREAATAAVRTAFTSPQSFYQQLVDRRQYLKDQADAKVTRLAGLEGDEAPTQKMIDDANKEASDAADDLANAQDTLASFQDLISDDSPVKDLVLETLKPDEGEGKGDDGGVLVSTIDGAYDAAADAKTTADEAKTTADNTASMIEGLTGDEGKVSMNEARSMQNESDIEALDGRVALNEGEIWDADGNSRIDANEMRSMANAMEIGMDENGMSRIDHNEARSMANAMEIGMDEDGMSRIDHNEARSMANETRSMANETRSMANDTRSMANETRSMANETAINGLRTSVGANEQAIIGLQDQMEIVRAGVAASMALAGMPAINGRGISIGVGSFDGESAFAVGFQIQGEMASFKVGVTSAGGETGASAGVGFQF